MGYLYEQDATPADPASPADPPTEQRKSQPRLEARVRGLKHLSSKELFDRALRHAGESEHLLEEVHQGADAYFAIALAQTHSHLAQSLGKLSELKFTQEVGQQIYEAKKMQGPR